MTGNSEGAKKATEKILKKNPNHFREMAIKSNKAYLSQPKEARPPRGFAANRELAREAGAKGGRKSRRGNAVHTDNESV